MNYKHLLLESSGFIVILCLWFLLFSLNLVHILILPHPLEVGIKLLEFGSTKEGLYHILATILRVAISFIIAAVLGISGGLLLGLHAKLDLATEKLIDFIRSIPPIALFPLFILLLGVSDTSRIAVATSVGTLIILINTKYGVRHANKIRTQMRKLYSLSRISFIWKVILPETFPHIFTGLKVAVSITLLVIIVTEMLLGTNYGLGQVLINSQIQYETETLFATLILLGILGTSFNFIFNKMEQKLFHWRQT